MGKKITLLNPFSRHHQLRRQICDQQQRLYRIAWSWCADKDLSGDLVQETITRALERLESLKDESRLEVWLTRILSNLYRDHLRKKTTDTLDETRQISELDTPEQALDRNRLISRTRDAVSALSNDHRQVLTLIDIAEFSYADAAHILDLPVGTVMSRLARARSALRRQMEPHMESAKVVALRRKS